jgi:hypothetical protein
VPALAAAALAALAAAFAPALGLALGLGLLALGTLATDTVAGLVMLVFGAALWFALARRNRGDAPLALAAPAFGVVRAAPAVPLLLGFTFEPLPAAAAAAFAALAVQAASALSGSGPPLLAVEAGILADPWRAFDVAGRFAAFASPGPYLAALAWAAGAAALSWLCRRGTRAAAGVGLAVATLVLLAGYAAWSAAGNGLVWPSVRLLQQLAASLILMAVVVTFGAPVRGEPDDDVTADEPG